MRIQCLERERSHGCKQFNQSYIVWFVFDAIVRIFGGPRGDDLALITLVLNVSSPDLRFFSFHIDCRQ